MNHLHSNVNTCGALEKALGGQEDERDDTVLPPKKGQDDLSSETMGNNRSCHLLSDLICRGHNHLMAQ